MGEAREYIRKDQELLLDRLRERFDEGWKTGESGEVNPEVPRLE